MRYFPSKIESKWQKKWLKNKTYEPDFQAAKKPFYNLMMFPYPSAEGLHIGAVRTFSGVDIYGRLKRMQGFDVFEPIGLDGFGIHSENYALKAGKHPVEHARDSEKNFYRQLGMIGNGFAWDERLETYDPEYYRWTQWIFVQMFKRGLAYRKKASVNWCPSCKTVLADEQVIAGECERCGSGVIKKDLEQWFFRITNYAERLLNNLVKIDWPESIKIAQRNWIGKSEGAEIEFRIKNSELRIKVFTTRPDTLFGTTYMVLGPEHSLIEKLESRIKNYGEVSEYARKTKSKTDEERIAEGREKTGVELKGVKAINPVNKEEIPVWVADYVLGHVGTGAIMAVPAHDQRDFEFAKKFSLPIRVVVKPSKDAKEEALAMTCHDGPGVLVNSGRFSRTDSEKAKWEITKFVGGENKVKYRLRDWLISRQRYWGPPIPLVFCENCAERIKNQESRIKGAYSKGELENPGWIAVREKDLPVKLPYIKNFRPTGTDKSPLAAYEKFYKTRCPKCGGEARRETDVSDAFLDSAWYFLRYPSVRDKKRPWTPAVTRKWLPVNMYIGGAEHAVLHLLYSRFLAMVFKDRGLLHFEEPFSVFRAHGLITKDGAKMSKSKGNVVNPDEYIKAYGIDAIRMYLAFLAPFEKGGDFRDTGIRGITRFLERVWRFGQNQESRIKSQESDSLGDLNRLVNSTVKKVTDDIENLQYNTAISALMILLNAFEANPESVSKNDFSKFLQILAPFAPHITEELWAQLRKKGSIHKSRWPAASLEPEGREKKTVVIQVNGKVRDRIEAGAAVNEQEMRKLVLDRPAVRKWLGGKAVRKVIYVPGRVVNIVA